MGKVEKTRLQDTINGLVFYGRYVDDTFCLADGTTDTEDLVQSIWVSVLPRYVPQLLEFFFNSFSPPQSSRHTRTSSKALESSGETTPTDRRTARPQDTALARFYGLPKVHKDGVPLRPIVSLKGTPTYGLAKWLFRRLKFLTAESDTTVSSSAQFLEKLEGLSLNPNEFMDLAIETIELILQSKYDETENRLGRAQVLQLLKFCLRTNFTFDGTIYEQLKGTPMGSPISGFIAEAVLQRDQVLTFQEHLNAVFPDIQFTMEEEENKQLASQHVLVCREACGGLKTKLFRKTTNTLQVLNFNSNHPISHKRSCVRTLYRRVETHCSEPEDKIAELQHLRRVFKANGYPRNLVNRCIRKRDERPNRTDTKSWRALPYVKNVSEAVGRLLAPLGVGVAHRPEATIRRLVMKPKDPLPRLETSGVVYRIWCNADKATTSEKPEDSSEREWPNTLQRCGEMTPAPKLWLIRRDPATHSNSTRPKFSQEVTTA
ncbi:hypothetical protein SprV_0401690700 [Sparganum proliferum]